MLTPLINDLCIISNPNVTIKRNDVTVSLPGALCAIVADNLAAHSIRRFFKSFSSIHSCRFCVIRTGNLKVEFMCNSSSLRTVDKYNNQVSLASHEPFC